MNKVKSLLKARWMSSLIFLLLLFLITGIAEPEFLSNSNIISCFNTATMYTLLAIGIAFVIMTGEIDVSIGSTLGLSAAMTGLIAKQDGSIAVMLLAVVASAARWPATATSPSLPKSPCIMRLRSCWSPWPISC